MISNSFCLKTGKWAMTVWFTQLPDLLLTPLFCIGCSWQNQSTSLHWKSNLFLWRGIPNFISFPIFIVKCGLWYEARPEGPGPNTQAGDAEHTSEWHTSEWQKIKYSVWESKGSSRISAGCAKITELIVSCFYMVSSFKLPIFKCPHFYSRVQRSSIFCQVNGS